MKLINLMKSKTKLLSITFLMLLTIKAMANDQDTRPFELKQANLRLNAVYNKVLGQLQHVNQIKLKKSQRAWIVFRDLDCTWAFGAEPLDCMIDRTEARAKELERTDFFDANGDYLSIDDK